MTYDENKVAHYDSPEEEIKYDTHHAQYGPGTGKVHPDDCEYCKDQGWDTHPEKTPLAALESQYRDHMAEYGPATGKSHPDDCKKCK